MINLKFAREQSAFTSGMGKMGKEEDEDDDKEDDRAAKLISSVMHIATERITERFGSQITVTRCFILLNDDNLY